jgi:hypothetical protein
MGEIEFAGECELAAQQTVEQGFRLRVEADPIFFSLSPNKRCFWTLFIAS